MGKDHINNTRQQRMKKTEFYLKEVEASICELCLVYLSSIYNTKRMDEQGRDLP